MVGWLVGGPVKIKAQPERQPRFNSRNRLEQMPVSGSLIIYLLADSIAGLGRMGELEYIPRDYY